MRPSVSTCLPESSAARVIGRCKYGHVRTPALVHSRNAELLAHLLRRLARAIGDADHLDAIDPGKIGQVALTGDPTCARDSDTQPLRHHPYLVPGGLEASGRRGLRNR